jgi:hypothetical protein
MLCVKISEDSKEWPKRRNVAEARRVQNQTQSSRKSSAGYTKSSRSNEQRKTVSTEHDGYLLRKERKILCQSFDEGGRAGPCLPSRTPHRTFHAIGQKLWIPDKPHAIRRASDRDNASRPDRIGRFHSGIWSFCGPVSRGGA